QQKHTSTALLASRSRVAPIKPITIPRLELMGALTAVRLMQTVSTALPEKIESVHFWTDSQVVLHWVASSPGKWRLFVANRVREICAHSAPQQWHFCPGREKPADLVSR